MREYAILGSVFVVMACRGGDAKPDSIGRDSATVAAPPTVIVAPPTDSIASRPRTTPADARKSPGGSKTTSGTTKPVFVPPPPPAAPVTESIRGIVSVVGTSRDRRVIVTSAAGGRMMVTGSLAPLIGHLAGADLWVEGASSGTSLEATRFLVKTVDGQPAIDGRLKTEGPALYIVSADGTRTRIVAPPPSFTGRDGVRVWITGDPSRGIASFGFIDPPG